MVLLGWKLVIVRWRWGWILHLLLLMEEWQLMELLWWRLEMQEMQLLLWLLLFCMLNGISTLSDILMKTIMKGLIS
jgi:hypothetical protein